LLRCGARDAPPKPPTLRGPAKPCRSATASAPSADIYLRVPSGAALYSRPLVTRRAVPDRIRGAAAWPASF
jgi:hypothetical protein